MAGRHSYDTYDTYDRSSAPRLPLPSTERRPTRCRALDRGELPSRFCITQPENLWKRGQLRRSLPVRMRKGAMPHEVLGFCR